MGLKTMMAVLFTFTERPHSTQYDCRTFNMDWRLSLSRAKSTRSSAHSRCVTLGAIHKGRPHPRGEGGGQSKADTCGRRGEGGSVAKSGRPQIEKFY